MLDLRSNPIGTSPEVMKFVLLCCPNLRIFNGRKVGDNDVVASSEWASSTSRGRSVNCLIEVVREMETLTAQVASKPSSTLICHVPPFPTYISELLSCTVVSSRPLGRLGSAAPLVCYAATSSHTSPHTTRVARPHRPNMPTSTFVPTPTFAHSRLACTTNS